MSNSAVAMPVRNRRGRPPKPVIRPACPKGHAGTVVLDGKRRIGKRNATRRFRCRPGNGDKPHSFTWPDRMRWPIDPTTDAPAHCEHCEQAFREGFGPRIGHRCRFTYHEIASALILVGKGISFRKASLDARRSADRWHRKYTMMRSDEGQLAALYVSAFGPRIIGELGAKKWPSVVAVDSLPLSRKAIGPDGKPRQPGQNAGEIAVATEHWIDPVTDRPMSRPIRMQLMGGKNRVVWARFFGSLEGRPDVIVVDGDGGADAAIGDLGWEKQGTLVYRCEAHLLLNAEEAAAADGMIEYVPTPTFNPEDELATMRRLMTPRRGRSQDFQRAELYMAIRESLRSQTAWVALQRAVKRQVPPEKKALRKWLKATEPLVMRQFLLRADGYLGPFSVGAVENTIRTLKKHLAGRAVQFGNRARFDTMLGLITLDLAGQADPDAYRRIVREQFIENGTRAAIAWKNHFDPGAASMDRLIVESSLGQAKAHALAIDQPRYARERAAARAVRAQRNLPRQAKRADGGRRTYSVRGLYVTDIPLLKAQWDDVRNVGLDPATIRAGSTIVVSWQCRTHPSHHWERSIKERATKGSLCPFEYGNRAGEDNSLRAKFPELAEEWHPTKNGEWTPDSTRPQADRKVWWVCPDGHDAYERVVQHRTIRGWGCPHPDHRRQLARESDAERATNAKRQRRIRRMRRAGKELLEGNVEASGTWQRVLSEDDLVTARANLELLCDRLGGDRAAADLVSRSKASIEYYRRGASRVSIVVALRLAHLVEVARALGGHVDMTAWLDRPNAMLDGTRPRDMFSGEWSPFDAGPASVLHSARAARKNRPAA